MLKPVIRRNDKVAKIIIWTLSVIVFLVVASLSRIELKLDLPFDPHIFAAINAVINSMVSVLLLLALWAVFQKKYVLHKNIMLIAIVLSILFLVSYIAHHLLTGSTEFKGEGAIRYLYFFILITHIFLAGIILPFILYTSYWSLSGEYQKHKKLARITWPIWFYVSVTGVLVYLLINSSY